MSDKLVKLENLKDIEDGFNGLQKTMTSYDARLEETGGKLSAIETLVKDVQKEFADRARMELGTSMAAKLFADHDVAATLTWDAIHKAPTKVEVKSFKGWKFAEPETDDLVARYQQRCDDLYILAAAMKMVDADGRMQMHRVQNLKFFRNEVMPLREKMGAALQKDGFAIGTAGGGAEWDVTGFSSRLWEMASLPFKLEGVIPTFVLPRSPFLFPVEIADLVGYLVAENTAAPPSTSIPDGKGSTSLTSSKTFTSIKLATMAFISKEIQEDSIVPMIPYLRGKLIRALNIAKEKAILRGFKTRGGVSGLYDSDTTGATSAGKAFDGLIDYALNVTALTSKDGGGAAVDTDARWKDAIRGGRKLMDDEYKGDAGELALVVSGNTAIDIGSCDAFRLWYATGGASTNREGNSTGYNPDGYGDFLVSKYMRTDLAATGVNSGTPANDVYTAAVQFYPQAWLLGEERSLTIEVSRERYFEYDVDAAKITWRGDMKAMLGGKHTVATVNIL